MLERLFLGESTFILNKVTAIPIHWTISSWSTTITITTTVFSAFWQSVFVYHDQLVAVLLTNRKTFSFKYFYCHINLLCMSSNGFGHFC